MSGCHHHTIETPAGMDFLTLLWWVFMTGLAGSFTHCILMCGPIAVAQLNIRLMDLPPNKMKEWEKIKAAFLTPYYIGKAITYAALTATAWLVTSTISNIIGLRIFGAIVLAVAAIFFLCAAFNKNRAFSGFSKNAVTKKFQNYISVQAGKLKLEPYGFKGLILGMILGLLPCGLVYGSIVVVVDSANNIAQAAMAMFVFGLATLPGLFVSAYAGTIIFTKYKPFFRLFYIVAMLLNSALLFYYAWKQLKFLF